jgi:predicted RNase H-like HicB family nuclease
LITEQFCVTLAPSSANEVEINRRQAKRGDMEKIINIHIEKLPEGMYLATSDDVQGLVAQGRTATEALEIARDVAHKLIEARAQRAGNINLAAISDSFDYPLIVNA